MKTNNSKYHLFFLFILSLNYIFPLLIFNNITLFYHDTLDSEIVYNKILGEILRGNVDYIKIFLNGEIQLFFLRRLFQPITLLYSAFNTELAYWITDILVKLTSYFTFYILAKKLGNKTLVCCLVASFYASINIPTHNSFGTAIFPYIIYLFIFKKNLNLKHYLIVLFFGLNSDLVFTIFSIPFLFFSIVILNENKKDIFNLKRLSIFLIFLFAIILSNFNLILLSFSDIILHRTEFVKEFLPLSKIFKGFFFNFFNFSIQKDFTLLQTIPLKIVLPFLFLICFFQNDKKKLGLLFIIIVIELIISLENSSFFVNLYNDSDGLLRTLNLVRCYTILPLLYSLLCLLFLKDEKLFSSKVLKYLVFVSLLFCQVNSSAVPFYKKYIKKEENYRNIYTFKEYYLKNDYSNFSKIIKDKRVMSIGIDPMMATMNGINSIDGYHNVYPLKYKKKFRTIISDELSQSALFKKYFDNWGSRVYAFVSDPKNILIDFGAAKKIGAKYVITKYEINDERLLLVCGNCSKFLKLYEIR